MSNRLELLLAKRARRNLRQDFGTWCEYILAPKGRVPAAHHRLMIRELQAVADGETQRLMMFLPPGSAKSTYTSVLFPSWWMARGETSLIATSHTASLAEGFSRKVREMVREHSRVLATDIVTKAVELWLTSTGGQYRAAGVSGAIAGFRADLALCDDLVKNREAADSKTWRDKSWDWFTDDLMTRLKPGAPMVVVGTRWHEDDVYGRLLKSEGERWKVITLPAVADQFDDPLGRKIGEYLWADDNYGYAALLKKTQAKSTVRTWTSLYQQQPRPTEGSIIKASWWRQWTEPVPIPEMTVVSLDLAYTKKDENDPSACTVWDVTTGANFRTKALLRFAWAHRLEFPELLDGIEDTLKSYKRKHVPLYLLVEGKGPGLSVVQELRRRKPDLNIFTVNPTTDKIARAHSVTGMFEDGVVWATATTDDDGMVKFKPWADAVINECAAFPLGSHDDLTDSVTQFLRHLRDQGFELHAEDAPEPPDFTQPAALY